MERSFAEATQTENMQSRLRELAAGSPRTPLNSSVDLKSPVSPLTSSPMRYASLNNRPGSLLGSSPLKGDNIGSPGEIEGKSSATSVIQAFRELQENAKQLGIARAQALTQIHNLRNELAETRRKSTLDRSKFEMEATDVLLREKSNREALALEHNEVRTRVAHAHEVNLGLQRQEQSRVSTIVGLEEEIAELKSSNRMAEEHLHNTLEDTRKAEKRVRELHDRIDKNAMASQDKRSAVQKDTHGVQQKITRAGKSSMRMAMRCTALEKYMGIILQINGDLCATIATTEESRAKIARISAKYMPPRYAWPVRPYTANLTGVAADDDDYVSPRRRSSPSLTRTRSAPASPTGGRPSSPQAHTVPMSPSEFAKQLMSANNDLDTDALQIAIESMSAMPNIAASRVGKKSSRQNVRKYNKAVASRRGRTRDYIPDGTTFAERIRRGQGGASHFMATRRSASYEDARDVSPTKAPVFMPSGKAGRSQNVIAAVSRASRAAGYLNATIASKVSTL